MLSDDVDVRKIVKETFERTLGQAARQTIMRRAREAGYEILVFGGFGGGIDCFPEGITYPKDGNWPGIWWVCRDAPIDGYPEYSISMGCGNSNNVNGLSIVETGSPWPQKTVVRLGWGGNEHVHLYQK